MQLIEAALLVLKLWLAVGLAFGVAFVIAGVQRVDPAAAGSGWGFRLLILPGCMIFWPKLALLWLRGRTLPIESSSHRTAASRRDV